MSDPTQYPFALTQPLPFGHSGLPEIRDVLYDSLTEALECGDLGEVADLTHRPLVSLNSGYILVAANWCSLKASMPKDPATAGSTPSDDLDILRYVLNSVAASEPLHVAKAEVRIFLQEAAKSTKDSEKFSPAVIELLEAFLKLPEVTLQNPYHQIIVGMPEGYPPHVDLVPAKILSPQALAWMEQGELPYHVGTECDCNYSEALEEAKEDGEEGTKEDGANVEHSDDCPQHEGGINWNLLDEDDEDILHLCRDKGHLHYPPGIVLAKTWLFAKP